MKTMLAIAALSVLVGACEKKTEPLAADAGTVVVEPMKIEPEKVESMPQPVSPQITDSVTQAGPTKEDAGVVPTVETK